MAFSEIEIKKIEKELQTFNEARRPPPSIRAQLDFGFRLSGQSVELFELRPMWRNPEVTQEIPYAKATYVKSQRIWKIYWHRADMKWHRYEPYPQATTLNAFLEMVAEDEYHCFFG